MGNGLTEAHQVLENEQSLREPRQPRTDGGLRNRP